MIRFQLQCHSQHQFEGWFKSGADFDAQRDGGLLSCPVCGDADIEKAVMAPAVARNLQRTREIERKAADTQTANVPAKPEKDVRPNNPAPKPDPETMARVMVAMRHFKTFVEKNFEDVGDQFPEEVRKMHYGEADEREIFGRAKLEDARELIEEGIDILPLPNIPELDS
jgi:hypothetical protein